MTRYTDLQAEAKELGLPATGTTEDLEERIAAAKGGGTAADVAGSASTVGAAGVTPPEPEATIQEVKQLPVQESAGPLGAHYVTGPDGRPIAVAADQVPPAPVGEVTPPAMATVVTERPANPEPGLVSEEHIVAVAEITPSTPTVPVIANPGPPDHLRG